MLKKCLLLMLLLCALLYTSCKKEDDLLSPQKENSSGNSNVNYQGARLADQLTGTSNIDNPASFRGLYVNDADQIIGNTSAENDLLDYAVANGINAFEFYGLKNLIKSSSNYYKVRSFLSRCSSNGIIYRINVIVYYTGSINTSDSTYLRKYNNSCSSSSQKITGVNLEWEWWNGTTTWLTYDATLKSYYRWTRTMSPNLTNEVYFGWFKNPTGMESTMANELIKNCDRIMVHDYRTSPDVSYMLSRLDYLGQAAISLGSTKKIIVLFSAEPSFMGPYYSTHTFDAAYQSIASQYSAVSFSGKSGLRIYGWQLFHYSYAQQFRP